jgi:hypothetical protein
MFAPYLTDIFLHRSTENGKLLFEKYSPKDFPDGVYAGAILGKTDTPFPHRMEFNYLLNRWNVRINELTAYDFIEYLHETLQIHYADACITAFVILTDPEKFVLRKAAIPSNKIIRKRPKISDEEFNAGLESTFARYDKMVIEMALPAAPENEFTIPAMLLHTFFVPGKKKDKSPFYSFPQLVAFINERSPVAWALEEKQTVKLLKREGFGGSLGKVDGIKGFYLRLAGFD